MLKVIDDTNIGAINNVDAAIKSLQREKEIIEKTKQTILNKQKVQVNKRKAPKLVSRSSKIIQLLDLPKNMTTIQTVVLI